MKQRNLNNNVAVIVERVAVYYIYFNYFLYDINLYIVKSKPRNRTANPYVKYHLNSILEHIR